jgi:hypothetical protein
VPEAGVDISEGTGTPIHVFELANGRNQQYLRKARATAESESFWAASTTASTSQVAADASRLSVLVTNNSTGSVYFRFDATAPTSASNGHHWYLAPGDRWEVPEALTTLAISVIASTASGHVVFHLGTAA